jgi:GT2 family glycosyltransferase
MSVAIGIPTAGRREQLHLTLVRLTNQTRAAQRLIVCPVSRSDFDETSARQLGFAVEIASAHNGLSSQRNAIINACATEDLLVFFDDDFYPASDYIERAVTLFEEHPDIVIATNHPVLDGAPGRGISHEEATLAVMRIDATSAPTLQLRPTYAGYGCNMVVRLAPVRERLVLFDENLPLYSWLEDVDFSRQLAPYGRVVQCNQLRGVHLGTKRGRTSGVRFGYSQVANPLYMLRKGSMNLPYALKQVGRNLLKNTVMALWPEPWVDRAGRFKGNTMALRDLVTGKLHPMNAKELE